MDLSELIKSYSLSQKKIFTAFCIQLPLCFSDMYYFIPEFQKAPFYVQAIFSCSFSILSLSWIYYILLLSQIVTLRRFSAPIIYLTAPMIFATACLFLLHFRSELTPSEFLKPYVLASTAIAASGFVDRYFFRGKNYRKTHKGKHNPGNGPQGK